MPLPSESDPAAIIRHLRAQLRALEDERDDLARRLDAAYEEIRQLRAKVVGRVNQAAAPKEE